MEQGLLGLLAILGGQHAGKSPVICFDFIDDDMNMLGFLTQSLNKGMGDIPDNLLFLRFCNTVLGDFTFTYAILFLFCCYINTFFSGVCFFVKYSLCCFLLFKNCCMSKWSMNRFRFNTRLYGLHYTNSFQIIFNYK